LQGDGNLVLKDVNGNPFWASNSAGKGIAPYQLVVQNSGNFIIVDSTNTAIFTSNVPGGGAPANNALKQGNSLQPSQSLTDTGNAYKITFTATGNLQVTAIASGAVLYNANQANANPGRAELQV
jgi:hypothetical protein